MPYNEELEKRIREVLDGMPGLTGRKMFGGIGFMLQGNMACGVHGESLIIRVGAGSYDEALSMPHARPFDITGRPMKGWVMINSGGYESDSDLDDWIQRGISFALTLPPKA